MHKIVKLLIVVSLVLSALWGLKFINIDFLVRDNQKRNIDNIVVKVVEPNNLEELTDKMGFFLQKASLGQITSMEKAGSFCVFWPDIVPVLIKENWQLNNNSASAELVDHLYKLFPHANSVESEHIYQFLFDNQTRQVSYDNLAKSLCFERLERLGCQLKFTANEKLPIWGKCPLNGKSYKLDSVGKKLSCWRDHLAFTYPQRKILGQPEEVYRQLAMGYYNSERLHRLDKTLLGQGPAAVREGEKVADIGCGVGCYIWSLSHGVGSSGRVYAQDIDKSVLNFVDFVKQKRHCTNVQICLAKRNDPKLPLGSLDRLYLIDALNVMVGIDFQVHGEASSQAKLYLRQLTKSLRPDGKIVVIDFLPYKNRPHLSKAQVRNIFAELGFETIGDQEATAEPSPMYALTFSRPTK